MSLLKIALFISDTLLFATPLLFTALGGMFTEKAGVTNIGLEGMMTIGAFAGAAVGYFTKSALLGFLAGGVAASLVALIHAIVSITFGADQVVSGIAINFIGPGVSLFICSLLFDGAKQTIPVAEGEGKMIKIFDNLTGIDFIDKILGQYVTTYVALGLVILISIYLYKTKFGLRLIAVGEHPKAAETLNVNVYLYRYFAVIVSGLLAGFWRSDYEFSHCFKFFTITHFRTRIYSFSCRYFWKMETVWCFRCMFIFWCRSRIGNFITWIKYQYS